MIGLIKIDFLIPRDGVEVTTFRKQNFQDVRVVQIFTREVEYKSDIIFHAITPRDHL